MSEVQKISIRFFDDRDTFMKGIDYSYYYEQEEWSFITNSEVGSDFFRNFAIGSIAFSTANRTLADIRY